MHPTVWAAEKPLIKASESAATVNGLALALHIKTPATVTTTVMHKTTKIFVIIASRILYALLFTKTLQESR
jgi:hypothetical protein